MSLFQPVKIKNENFMEYCVRGISGPLARLLAKTPVTPNQVTLSRVPLMVLVLWWFARGDFGSLVLASVGLIVFEILDHVDGDLACLKNQKSVKGQWYDDVSDRVLGMVGGFMGLAITVGVYRQTHSPYPWLVFGILSCGFYLFQYFLHSEIADPALRQEIVQEKDKSRAGKIAHFFYYWVELLILPAVVLYVPFEKWFHLNSMFLLLIGYAVMYNLFWIAILVKQYQKLSK